MPLRKRRRSHHSEGLTPVEPTRQPAQGEPHGMSGTPGLDVACLVDGKLFTPKEVSHSPGFCGRQSTAEGEGRSHLDSPLIHDGYSL